MQRQFLQRFVRSFCLFGFFIVAGWAADYFLGELPNRTWCRVAEVGLGCFAAVVFASALIAFIEVRFPSKGT
jgi:hypothetical protein